MKIAIGNDHAAVELKNCIKAYLLEAGYEVDDLGIGEGEKIDYPLIAEKVALEVVNKHSDLGIVMCGTGIGVSISANKIKGIRAACCSDPYSAKMSREHNDANILCFGSRVVGGELAKMIVKNWLDAKFLGERHLRRVELINKLDER